MRRLLLALLIVALGACTGSAQTGSPQTKANLTSEINTNFPNNITGAITPALLRQVTLDMVNSWQQYLAVNAQTGTSYTIAVTDYGQLVTFNNPNPIAVTLPQGTLGNGFSPFNVIIANLGTGTVTITPVVSTINGAASLTVTTGQQVWVTSDGTNYKLALVAGIPNNVNGVIFPANPSVGTVPYVSGPNAITYGIAPVTGGGTGQSSFAANLPLIGNGSSAIAQGTRSGNTTVFATANGVLGNGHCITADSNGNLIDGGAPCVSATAGVNAGTTNQAAYYATNGSVVSGISAGAIPFTVTNGTTFRKDQDRFNDNGIAATDIGVDCTAATDSTTALQTWINANLNGGHLRFPSGCHLKTSSTLTITSAINIVFEGAGISGSGFNPPVQWDWVGSNGGSACTTTYSSCVFVMDFEHSDHPTVQNIYFEALTNCPDGFLKFDGNPGSHIGTSGRILHNHFSAGSCSNKNFIAVDISHTATGNQEDYIVQDNSTFCSNSIPNNIAHDVSTTINTVTITSASGPFSAGNVGHRLRLTYDNNTNPGNHSGTSPPWSRGYFDTTIAAVAGANTATLAVAVPWTVSPTMAIIDGGAGIAYRNGASQNAIQQTFSNLQYSNCAFGVYISGGGVQVNQLSNGFSDVGMFIGGFVAQNTSLDYYASEGDMIAVMQQNGSNAPFEISNSRASNGVQGANGFFWLGGNTILRNSMVNFGVPNSNSVLIAPFGSIGVSALGAITGGTGYTTGTYTGVTLTGGAYPSNPQATIVVSGGAVTTVTITSQGSGGFPTPGDVLTTANTNIGGTGSGFSVPIAANVSPTTLGGGGGASGNDVFGTIFSFNNNWVQGCCSTTIDWAHLGLDQFANSVPATTANDAAIPNQPQKYSFGCFGGASECLYIQNQVQNGVDGVGVVVNMANAISGGNNTTAFRSTQGGGIGTTFSGGTVSHTGFQIFPPTNGPTTLTGFDAGWNAANLNSPGTVYGFHAETPLSVSGTITNMYGFECDQQKVVNVTTGWCFYNANTADKNFFAGPAMLGAVNTLTVPAGGLGMQRISADGVAVGNSGLKLEAVCGTNAGTAKIIAYAGTSTVATTVLDNIGGGVSGC